MSADTDPMLSRLKRLPLRLRIAHLAALLRCEREGSARAAQLTALLRDQSAVATRDGSAR
jgi:hypothetical protein